jgi:hypothetical protein
MEKCTLFANLAKQTNYQTDNDLRNFLCFVGFASPYALFMRRCGECFSSPQGEEYGKGMSCFPS